MSYEVSRFTFDPRLQRVTFRKRFGWKVTSGEIPFHAVKRVLLQRSFGDEDGVPSRRVCLQLASEEILPLVTAYVPDSQNEIFMAVDRIRAVLGLEDDVDDPTKGPNP